LIRVVAIAERVGDRKFGITFPSLWLETPAEKAARELVEAQTATAWITIEVLTPDEVAIARFGSSEPQPYRIDPLTRLPDPRAALPPTPTPAPPPKLPAPPVPAQGP
jgi:hypothetical protein